LRPLRGIAELSSSTDVYIKVVNDTLSKSDHFANPKFRNSTKQNHPKPWHAIPNRRAETFIPSQHTNDRFSLEKLDKKQKEYPTSIELRPQNQEQFLNWVESEESC
jgi:hypothetical protein